MTTCPEKGDYSNGVRNLCHCIAVLKGGLQWQIQTGKKKKRERETILYAENKGKLPFSPFFFFFFEVLI